MASERKKFLEKTEKIDGAAAPEEQSRAELLQHNKEELGAGIGPKLEELEPQKHKHILPPSSEPLPSDASPEKTEKEKKYAEQGVYSILKKDIFKGVNFLPEDMLNDDQPYKLRINIDPDQYDEETQEKISDILVALNAKHEEKGNRPLQAFKYTVLTLSDLKKSDAAKQVEFFSAKDSDQRTLPGTPSHTPEYYDALIKNIESVELRDFLESVHTTGFDSSPYGLAQCKTQAEATYNSSVRLIQQAQFTLYGTNTFEDGEPKENFLIFLKELEEELTKNKILPAKSLAETDLPVSEHLSFRQQAENIYGGYVVHSEAAMVESLKGTGAKSKAYKSIAAQFPAYAVQRETILKEIIPGGLFGFDEDEFLWSEMSDEDPHEDPYAYLRGKNPYTFNDKDEESSESEEIEEAAEEIEEAEAPTTPHHSPLRTNSFFSESFGEQAPKSELPTSDLEEEPSKPKNN